MNNVPLDNALARLISSGIIKKDGGFYSINFENNHAEQIMNILITQYKRMKNLPLDVYLLLADIAYELSSVRIELWLFGSYSKVTYSDKSDVDIAILGQKLDKIEKNKVKKTIAKLEKTYGKKIEGHFFEKNAFYNNKKDPLVKDILQNGIKII